MPSHGTRRPTSWSSASAGAGASAALEAREGGAEVILIDRFGGGGTTAYSGGVIYAGATRFQREAGFDDTVDDMLDYLRQEVGDVRPPETPRTLLPGQRRRRRLADRPLASAIRARPISTRSLSARGQVPLLFGQREVARVRGRRRSRRRVAIARSARASAAPITSPRCAASIEQLGIDLMLHTRADG